MNEPLSVDTLAGGVDQYSAWRKRLSDALWRYGTWLARERRVGELLVDRIDALRARLAGERLRLALVGEFSRGKSELINALFFGDCGRRIVPSSAGRTTMCPTEFLHDEDRPPCIRLLPIETRADDVPLAELRERDDAWTVIEFDPQEPDTIVSALAFVAQTRRMSAADARRLGLEDVDGEGPVDVSRWRHAIVSFPHPMLAQGLSIIDTPGLNAVGVEPELTYHLLPSAHALLFVLAADTGVTRSDLAAWQEHAGTAQARFVVLNKIDGLWDGLVSDFDTDREIARQVEAVAQALQVDTACVFPLSAQKGLVAKVRGDAALLARSRVPVLEAALVSQLLPRRRELLGAQARRDFDVVDREACGLMQARRAALAAQLDELAALRGRNRALVEQMAARVRIERDRSERALQRLKALRAVHARLSRSMAGTLGIDTLKAHALAARESMRASAFSSGLRGAMERLLISVRADFASVAEQSAEMSALMSTMYRTFDREHGLSLGEPLPLSLARHLAELDAIESLYRRRFGPFSLLVQDRAALTRKFLESVAARLRDVYEAAHRELEAWMRALMAPPEGQLREQQAQLKQRLDSVRRAFEAGGSLEGRIAELQQSCRAVDQDLERLAALADAVRRAAEPRAARPQATP